MTREEWQRLEAGTITSLEAWNEWMKRPAQRELRRRRIRTLLLMWAIGVGLALLPGLWIGWPAFMLPLIAAVPLSGASVHIWEADGHSLPGGDGDI